MLPVMSTTELLQPAFEAISDCDEALVELEERCCKPERSPRMKALGDSLDRIRTALEAVADDHDAASVALVHMEDVGAQIGRLQVGCCAPNRLPLYARILQNLTTAQRAVNKATGGH